MLWSKSLTPAAHCFAHSPLSSHMRLRENGKRLARPRTRSQNVHTITTILVAWNQEDHVTKIFVIDWRNPFRNGFRKNFPAVIDVESICKLEAGTWGNDTVQVNHACALLPYKCVEKVVAVRRPAHNLPSRIDRSATTARLAINRSEVQNLTVFPTNSIMNTRCWQIGRAGNHARIVDPDRLRVIAPQSPRSFIFPFRQWKA